MRLRFFLPVVLSAVVLLTVPACTQPATDTGGSTPSGSLSHDDLQHQRWKHHFERREADPSGVNARWALYGVAGLDNTIQRKDTSTGLVLDWENVGTNTSGRILSYAFDPVDPLTIWVGAASGGLWRTTDGGENWQPMTDGLPSMAVSTVAVHPRDPQTLLFGTQDPFDGGLLHEYLPPHKRRFGNGVLRSTDGGQSWQGTSLLDPDGFMNGNALAWDAVRPDTVYLAASNGVWQSTDAGVTWGDEPVLWGNAKSIVLNKRSPDTLYAALARPLSEADTTAGVWQSTDAGAHWTLLTEGLFDPESLSTSCGMCMHLSLAEEFPEVVYYSIEMSQGDALYKTSDGGAHWQPLPAVDSTGNTLGFWKVHVSPVDTNVVFVGGVYLYRTQDGGTTWGKVGQLEQHNPLYFASLKEDSTQAWSIHVDHHAFGFHPADSNTVYDFSDGGVYVSTDGGDRWMYKNNGLMTLQMYSLGSSRADPTLFGAATQDQGQLILKVHEGKGVWRKWLRGDGMRVLFHDLTADRIYASAQHGNPWILSIPLDANKPPVGNDIVRIKSGLGHLSGSTSLWMPPLVVDPVDPQVLYTATYDSLFRTTWDEDIASGAALHWQSLVAIDTVSVLSFDRVNSVIIYAYSSTKIAPALWRSLDDGATWDSLAYHSLATWPGAYVSDLEADPDVEGMLYATRSSYRNQVWRSTDSARTWVDITNNLPPFSVNSIAITPDSSVTRKQIHVGTDMGVYMAYADQRPENVTWIPLRGGLPAVVVSEVHFHPADRTLRVGTYGRGFWITKLPEEQ